MENSRLESLDKWFCANTLKVTAKKNQFIALGNRQNLRNLPKFNVTFCDISLVPCNEAKNLGVTFDETLSWDSQVGVVSCRCTETLIGVSHVRHTILRDRPLWSHHLSCDSPGSLTGPLLHIGL